MVNTDCKQFLSHVLPRTGPYCISTMEPGTEIVTNIGAETIDDAVETARYQDETEEKHTFVAVGAIRKLAQFNAKGHLETKRDTPNIRGLRAYTMDIDAGPHHKTGRPRAYPTAEAARAALQKLLDHYGLPAPTVVQSGQGLHVWWTLTDEVDAETWKAHGKALSNMAYAIDVQHDAGRTTGCTSILRVAGRRNHKYAEKPIVQVLEWGADTPTEDFHALLKDVPAPGKAASPSTAGIPGLEGGPKISLPENNTAKVYTPNLDIAKLDAKCDAWYLATNDEAQANEHVPEPVWFRMLQLAVHVGGRETAHAISHLDPRYTEEDTDAKIDVKLMKCDAVLMGPPSCEQMRSAWKEWKGKPNPCAGCEFYNAETGTSTITSPAVACHVGVDVEQLPPNQTERLDTDTGEIHIEEVPPPPQDRYVRLPSGMALRVFNAKTKEEDLVVFCPYDMYPKRLQQNEKGQQKGVVWMINFPIDGWKERHIEHVGTPQLRVTLNRWGIFIDPKHIEIMAAFMSAYTDKLQRTIPTEIEFDECGWRDTGFVLGNKLINKKGIVETHAMSDALKSAAGWVKTAGERSRYIDALVPYGRDGAFAYRLFFSMSGGSIFFRFTQQIAATFNASGESGVGKSTIMKVAAAMFGDWEGGMMREFTRQGAEKLSSYGKHLPLFIDEATGKKDGEMADFLFHYSGGKGKTKLSRESHLRDDVPTWRNICMTNSNTDVYASVTNTVKDMQAHLARIIQIEFPAMGASPIAKEEADDMLKTISENYGHLIVDLLQWAVPREKDHADAIKAIENEIGKRIGGNLSLERMKISQMACAIYFMEAAFLLGYINTWPIGTDRDAMIEMLISVRDDVKKLEVSPEDYVGSFMNQNIAATLILNAKAAGNIDNVVQKPYNALFIRVEFDKDLAYFDRAEFFRWCQANGIVANRCLIELVRTRVILRDNLRINLGAGTNWSGNRTTTFEVDMKRLSGTITVVPSLQPAASAAPNAAAI